MNVKLSQICERVFFCSSSSIRLNFSQSKVLKRFVARTLIYQRRFSQGCKSARVCACVCVWIRGWISYDMWQLVGQCQRGRLKLRRKWLLPWRCRAEVADGRVARSCCQLKQWELERNNGNHSLLLVLGEEGRRHTPDGRDTCRLRCQRQGITLLLHFPPICHLHAGCIENRRPFFLTEIAARISLSVRIQSSPAWWQCGFQKFKMAAAQFYRHRLKRERLEIAEVWMWLDY